jgi:hypothetical protein
MNSAPRRPRRTSWHRRPFFDVKLLNAMCVRRDSSKHYIVSELREREDLRRRLRGLPLASRILENRRVGPCFGVNRGIKLVSQGVQLVLCLPVQQEIIPSNHGPVGMRSCVHNRRKAGDPGSMECRPCTALSACSAPDSIPADGPVYHAQNPKWIPVLQLSR